MAARVTRSASGATSSSDDASRCLLLALSHDELGVIVEGLADPLQPVVAVALSSTCLGLRTPLGAALDVLKERHEKAKALCRKLNAQGVLMQRHEKADALCDKVGTFLDDLRSATVLRWENMRLSTKNLATLAMILPWMPSLEKLDLDGTMISDFGMQTLFGKLASGAVPAVAVLWLRQNNVGPAGAEALAGALRRGALPRLEKLFVGDNPLGDEGLASLTQPLRKMPALVRLDVGQCGITDKGVAALVDNLGEDDFKALEQLDLEANLIADAGCAKLVVALKSGALPAIEWLFDPHAADHLSEHVSVDASAAVDAALNARRPQGRSAEA